MNKFLFFFGAIGSISYIVILTKNIKISNRKLLTLGFINLRFENQKLKFQISIYSSILILLSLILVSFDNLFIYFNLLSLLICIQLLLLISIRKDAKLKHVPKNNVSYHFIAALKEVIVLNNYLDAQYYKNCKTTNLIFLKNNKLTI